MKKKNKKLTVYSTNPNFEYNEENDENLPINPEDQLLEVWIDKHRAGKTAVIIKGFIGDLTEVQKQALLDGDYLTYGGIPQRGKLEVAGANNDLKRLYSLIEAKNLDEIAFINKGLVKGLYYYTGIIFEIYSKRLGKVIASGGQYDNLCKKFGYDCPAVGFAINLNYIHGDLSG